MSYNVLIVEDQPLIALGLEDAIEALGHKAVGIARNTNEARALASAADMAFVDVNLEDGPTGPVIGRELAAADIAVLFMTSDPQALGDGVPGTLGIIEKPVFDRELTEAIQFVADRRAGMDGAVPPGCLVQFSS
ncbi:response regulator [Rhizobium deserti]|uniref:Response regulator n=2 Tax=Rhizobium deserti TaxID=2547961 RepID=A0A4R5UN29_9HYPH|nr:response regulator [Rhizobium deserti]